MSMKYEPYFPRFLLGFSGTGSGTGAGPVLPAILWYRYRYRSRFFPGRYWPVSVFWGPVPRYQKYTPKNWIFQELWAFFQRFSEIFSRIFNNILMMHVIYAVIFHKVIILAPNIHTRHPLSNCHLSHFRHYMQLVCTNPRTFLWWKTFWTMGFEIFEIFPTVS